MSFSRSLITPPVLYPGGRLGPIRILIVGGRGVSVVVLSMVVVDIGGTLVINVVSVLELLWVVCVFGGNVLAGPVTPSSCSSCSSTSSPTVMLVSSVVVASGAG